MIVINMRFWWLRLFFPSSLPFIIIDACGCRLSFIIFRLASSLWKNVCIQLVFAHFIGPPIKFTSNVFRNFKNNLRWLGKFHFGKLRVGWADNFWGFVELPGNSKEGGTCETITLNQPVPFPFTRVNFGKRHELHHQKDRSQDHLKYLMLKFKLVVLPQSVPNWTNNAKNCFPFSCASDHSHVRFVRSFGTRMQSQMLKVFQIENDNRITRKIHVILRCYWRCRLFLFSCLMQFLSFFLSFCAVQQWFNKRSMNFYFSFRIHSNGILCIHMK